MKKEKKPSSLGRLMGYVGKYRYLTYASWVLSACSASLDVENEILIQTALWQLQKSNLQKKETGTFRKRRTCLFFIGFCFRVQFLLPFSEVSGTFPERCRTFP